MIFMHAQSRTFTRILTMLMLVVLAGMLLAACGGDADSSSDAKDDADAKVEQAQAEADDAKAEAVAAQELVREAYSTGFEAAVEQLDAVGDQFVNASDWNDYRKAVAVLQAVLASMTALTPPEAIAEDHEALNAALRRVLVAAKAITATSTEASDGAALTRIDAAFDDAGTAAAAISAEL